MDWEWKFELQNKEKVGVIELGDKVRVSDPCYTMDTWCAGTLDNVLFGTYHCYSQRSDTGTWGIRIANIEVRHEDYLGVEATEVQNIDVGVDSGQCGIYDLDYFIEARKDKNGRDEWYDRVCNKTYVTVDNPNYHSFRESSFWKPEFEEVETYLKETDKEELGASAGMPSLGLIKEYIQADSGYVRSVEHSLFISKFAANAMDNKCLVSSSGDGDGSYTCLVGRNEEGKIVSIKIDYYSGYDEEDE